MIALQMIQISGVTLTKIRILSIGNELLEGKTINTNASFLASCLYDAGYLAEDQVTILDDAKTIRRLFKESISKFDLTVCSGGLGPTLDDITLDVAADFFNMPLELNQALLKKNQKRYKSMKIPNLERTARVPKGAQIFASHHGTVPGYIFEKEKKMLILLPGVPYEFRHLVEKELMPLVLKRFPLTSREYKKVIRFCRIPESAIAPTFDELKKEHPLVDFGIYPHLGILSVHIKSKGKDQKEAYSRIDPILKFLKKKYAGKFFDGKYQTIGEAIHHYMISKKKTLATAESCSGGALAAYLTQISDASKYFQGSVVAYQNDVKKRVLGVLPSTLSRHGPVSEECAKEMALGAQKLFKTDFAFATTGIAGPKGGTKEKPVGSVWIAIAHKNKIIKTELLELIGPRDVIIERTLLYSLAEFWMMRDNL